MYQIGAMKKSSMRFITFAMLSLSLFFASCGNPCKDVVCNEGFCVEGDCVCDAGYETLDCSVAYSEKFSGTYEVNETCDSTGSQSYLLTVAPSTTEPDYAIITGLYQVLLGEVAAQIDVDGLDFEIASNDVGPGSIQSVGTCTANSDGSTLNIVYEFTADSTDFFEQCTAVLIRQ
ncbi:MAG: hypothetical protein RLZZ519_1218 [Bacteroidota bacterium]